ncbi:Mur ligase family protein [Patescibacteria group bacterium]|nr:Mur ligase family protein [Patescibacteria group bacterium]
MDIRLITAIAAGKSVKLALTVFQSGGTAAPGLITETIDKNALKKISSGFKQGVILISGTNGKTTTARLLTNALTNQGYTFLANSAGSNLKRGIISVLLEQVNLTGRPRRKIDFGIFECDEMALIEIAKEIKPRLILLTNLFRDQLDRYGEVETIRKKWLELIRSLPNETKVILNADDPGIRSLADYLNEKRIFFYGIGFNPNRQNDSIISDFSRCPNCGASLYYQTEFFSHLGDYVCSKCGLARPKLDLSAVAIENEKIEIAYCGRTEKITTPLKGFYNVYNLLAAFSIGLNLKIDFDQIQKSLEKFKPAFGRQEIIKFNSKELFISLAKNPVGLTETIKTISADPGKKTLIFLLNDKIADGVDVSWIWDVDFNSIKNQAETIIFNGRRPYDMGLRLKYADLENRPRFIFCRNLNEVFKNLAEIKIERVYIFPTYTALMDLKKFLARRGYKKFWT